MIYVIVFGLGFIIGTTLITLVVIAGEDRRNGE